MVGARGVRSLAVLPRPAQAPCLASCPTFCAPDGHEQDAIEDAERRSQI
jgi:hypothetical protein